jgi:starch phosphorylase
MLKLFAAQQIKNFPIKCEAPFQRLPELAYNLWWSWRHEAQALFHDLDPEHWLAHRNPVKLLRERGRRLQVLANDRDFVEFYRGVLALYEEYLMNEATWFAQKHSGQENNLVAYFSPEFALHECLPIYSGGLGVLAGDHVKTASDLGLPFIGVGLLYKNGYFTQRLDKNGQQQAIYPTLNFSELPIVPLHDRKGKRLFVKVEMAERTVVVQCWLAQVGSAYLILLDTDVAQNTKEDRAITSQLYGGDRETRIMQEIVLGMGGVRALTALGIAPKVWHLNEGHVAFLCLERIRELMKGRRLAFEAACEAVAASTVFTTHTPVPAGNETFELPLVHKYFRGYCKELKLDLSRVLDLGLQSEPSGWKYFSMTVMALKLSRASNGVSQLHGEVSREMWQHLWPATPRHEAPITAITNGVHADTWLALMMSELFDEFLGENWRDHLADPKFWRKVEKIPHEVLWQVKQEMKHDLIEFARERLAEQYRRAGASAAKIKAAESVLDPGALTIGFARRFAAYKRADLIFSDMKRLEQLVNNSKRPVQIIFAGKAHPADLGGRKILQRVYRMTQRPALRDKVILLEDYDMNVGRMLVQGVDLWLNNPRRPMEASGTSGQKVPLNAGLNCSILDGWWEEGYNGENGWKFGEASEYANEAEQDRADASDLYRVLEREVIPLYYKRDRRGRPQKWIERVKQSMITLIPQFNTNTMVQNYAEQFYVPASARHELFTRESFAVAKESARAKEMYRANWPTLHFAGVELKSAKAAGQIEVTARVYLGALTPESVQADFYFESEQVMIAAPMKPGAVRENGVYEYRARVSRNLAGREQARVRVMPKHPAFAQQHETGLVCWSEAF